MNLNKIPNFDQISNYLTNCVMCILNGQNKSLLSVRFRSIVLAHTIHHLKIMIFEARLHYNQFKSQKNPHGRVFIRIKEAPVAHTKIGYNKWYLI